MYDVTVVWSYRCWQLWPGPPIIGMIRAGTFVNCPGFLITVQRCNLVSIQKPSKGCEEISQPPTVMVMVATFFLRVIRKALVLWSVSSKPLVMEILPIRGRYFTSEERS